MPATTLNVLAAAWIQFQNHDWFSHGDNRRTTVHRGRRSPTGDEWAERRRCSVRAHAPATARRPTAAAAADVRQHGHALVGRLADLRLDRGALPRAAHGRGRQADRRGRPAADETDPKLDGIDLTGFSDNYWIGLALLHTLFAKEHNAICDHLKGAYPTWDDERLFLTARLVNSALMAKIHTVEWTPGILANPVLERGDERQLVRGAAALGAADASAASAPR